MSDPALVIPIVSLVAIAAVISLGFARRAGRSPTVAAQRERDDALSKLDERIERLERAIDVIAVEMERVGEGQRFLTKVLVEREAKQD